MKKIITLLVSFVTVISLIAFVSKRDSLNENEREVILHYLDKEMIPPSSGGDIISSFKLLGIGDKEIYIWAHLQEYYEANGKLEKGTALSCPIVLMIDRPNDQLVIIGNKIPRNGEYYPDDIEVLFPRRLRHKIFSFSESAHIEQLEKDIEERLNN